MARRRPSEAKAIAAIDKCHGNLTNVAKELTIARSTMYEMVKASPSLRSALDDARERRLDEAEDWLRDKMEAGDTTAIIFFLKTQGKSRGYIERQDIGIGQAEPPAFDWDRAIGRLAPRPVGDTEPSGNGESPKRG